MDNDAGLTFSSINFVTSFVEACQLAQKLKWSDPQTHTDTQQDTRRKAGDVITSTFF
jgi:hypothetical protein